VWAFKATRNGIQGLQTCHVRGSVKTYAAAEPVLPNQ
jgi:hypothetical protein